MQSQVHFQKTTKIILVPKICNETNNSVWYSVEDFTQIQHDLARTVGAMRRRKPINKHICYRGLEHLESDAHIEQRRIHRDCVITAVLKEQAMQRASGIIDINKIAEASCYYSRWAKEMASILGDSDTV